MSVLVKILKKSTADATRVRLNSVFKAVKALKPEAYLDCGCSNGLLTRKISKIAQAKKVYGIEIVDEAIAIARKRGIKVFKGDLNKPLNNIKSNSMDLITSLETIEHLYDTDTFITEVYRILKPGGNFVLTTENLASWHNIFALINGRQPYTGPYISKKFPIGHRPFRCYWDNEQRNKMPPHINVMTNKSLIQLLMCYGLKIDKVNPSGYYPFNGLLRRLFTYIDPNHSLYIVLKARKPND